MKIDSHILFKWLYLLSDIKDYIENNKMFSAGHLLNCVQQEINTAAMEMQKIQLQPKDEILEEPCNFCGTPDLENPKKKCSRTSICTNENPKDD